MTCLTTNNAFGQASEKGLKVMMNSIEFVRFRNDFAALITSLFIQFTSRFPRQVLLILLIKLNDFELQVKE